MKRNFPAFTLVELLVVIAIIGVLIGMALPGVQAIRESSRRAACVSHLIPMGMAIQGYHDRWLHYPVGTVAQTRPIEQRAQGNHHNWLGRILDLMDQPNMASAIDRSVSVYGSVNRPVLDLGFPGARCPSSPGLPSNASDYAGLHHSDEAPIAETHNGVFVLNTTISRADVADGISNTAFLAEKITSPDDLGWLSGTRATLRNVGGGIVGSLQRWTPPTGTTVGTIGSYHPGGAHLMFGSGEISFRTSQTDLRILKQMVNRSDGGLPAQWMSLDDLRKSNAAKPPAP